VNTFKLSRGPGRGIILSNVLAFITQLPESKDWQIEIKPYVKRRSNDQNRALWGVAYATLSKTTGNDPEDLHTYFLGEWSGWEVIDVMGQHKRVPMRRSSKLTTAEFSEFYEFIQRRAAEAGYNVPSPGEYDG